MTGMANNTTTSSEIDAEIEKLKQQEQDALTTINDQHTLIFKIKENIKLLQRSKLFCVPNKDKIDGNVNGNGHQTEENINGGV